MSMWRNLARVNIAYVIGSAANSAAQFLLVPYLVNALTSQEYGAWSLFEVAILVLDMVMRAGLDVGLMREYWFQQDEVNRARLTGTILMGVTLWGGVVVAGFVALLPVGVSFFLPGTPRTLIWVPVVAWAEAYFALFLTLFRIRERAGTFVALSIGRIVLFMGAAIGLVHAGYGVIGALAGRFVGTMLSLSIAAMLGARLVSLRPDWAALRQAVRYGLPLMPSNLASYILLASDRYVLRSFATLEAVATYSFACKIATTLNALVTRPFALDWAPRRFKIAQSDDAPQRYARILILYLFVGLFFSLLVLAMAPAVYAWVAPPAYYQGMSVVPVALAAYLIYGLGYPLNVGMMLRNKTGYAPLVSGVAAALCLGLNFWWIPRYGMMGAVWATLLSYAVRTAGLACISLWLYPVPYSLRSILLISLGALLSYAGVMGVGKIISGSEVLELSIKLSWVMLIFAAVAFGLLRRAMLPATFWRAWGEEAEPLQ